MVAQGPASVAVTFTGDAESLNNTLIELQDTAEETATAVEGSFSEMADEVDADLEEITTQVEALDTQLDELDGNSAKVTVTADTEQATTDIDDLKTKADALEAEKPTLTPKVDDAEADTELDKLSAKAAKLSTDSPTITPKVDDADAYTKLAALTTKADELDKEKPEITPGVDDAEADTDLDKLSAKADKLSTDAPTLKATADTAEASADLDKLAATAEALEVDKPELTPVADTTEATTALDKLKALIGDIARSHNITLGVDDEAADASIDHLDEKVDTLTDRPRSIKVTVDADAADVDLIEQKVMADLGGSGSGGGTKGPTGVLAKAMSGKADEIISGATSAAAKTIELGAVVGLAGWASEMGVGLVGLVSTVMAGAIPFVVALTGQKNPVANNFKNQLEEKLTSFDTAMSADTGPAMTSLLAPITAWLTDNEPLVKGFSAGLTSFAGAINTMLTNKSVQTMMNVLGTYTKTDTTQLGPIIADIMQGALGLLVQAQPLISQVLSLGASMGASFKNVDLSSQFGDLAATLKKNSPEIHVLVNDFFKTASQFLTDLKPLEGMSFGLVGAALADLGSILKVLQPVISTFATVVSSISSLPGGKWVTGLSTLMLVIAPLRNFVDGLLGVAAKLAASHMSGGLGKVLQTLTGTSNTTSINTAGTNMLKASETMQTAADKMSDAGKAQDTAGVEENAAGEEEMAAGAEQDVAAGGTAAKFLGVLGAGGALGGVLGGAAAALAPIALAGTAMYGVLKAANALSEMFTGFGKFSPQTIQRSFTNLSSHNTGPTPAPPVNKTYADEYNEALKDAAEGLKVNNALMAKLTTQDQTTVSNMEKAPAGFQQAGAAGSGKVYVKISAQMKQAGIDSGKGFNDGVKEGLTDAASQKAAFAAASAAAQGVIDAFNKTTKSKSPSLVFKQIGQDLMAGLAQGITAGVSVAVAAAVAAADKVIAAVKAATGTHSPSTLYAQLGMSWMQGLAGGITAGVPQVSAAMTSASAKVSAAATTGSHAGSSSVNSSPTIVVQVSTMTGTFDQGSINQIKTVVGQQLKQHQASLTAGLRGI